jgi:periplasmic copper chaperone A
MCLSIAAYASAAPAQNVVVRDAWARASVPGQTTASVYLDLTSDSDAAVVAAESALAWSAELHSMTVTNGVMRMRPLSRLELPAGQTVKFSSSGIHLMLVDLKAPLKPGQRVPLLLTIQSPAAAPKKVKVEAEVRGTAQQPHHH